MDCSLQQASPSMGFSRQESWCGLPFPSPGDLPDPGIEPRSSTLQADALSSEPFFRAISKGLIQSIANLRREGMKRQRRGNQETVMQPWVRILVQRMHIIKSLNSKMSAFFTPEKRPPEATLKELEKVIKIAWGQIRGAEVVQLSSLAQSCLTLQPHGLQHARPPCPSPAPGAYSNSCPLSRWCHPTISSSVVPFSSCLQSFLASGSFQMSPWRRTEVVHTL